MNSVDKLEKEYHIQQKDQMGLIFLIAPQQLLEDSQSIPFVP